MDQHILSAWAEDNARLELRIADVEAERDIYRDVAFAALDQLHDVKQRNGYLEQQADRLFDENRLLRSRSLSSGEGEPSLSATHSEKRRRAA